jgi:LPXTG-motif cell wall-anchored protein
MKSVKKIVSFLMMYIVGIPFIMAQDEGTFLESVEVPDSTYMEQTLSFNTEQGSGSNLALIIIIAVVIIAVAAFVIIRKKKKK